MRMPSLRNLLGNFSRRHRRKQHSGESDSSRFEGQSAGGGGGTRVSGKEAKFTGDVAADVHLMEKLFDKTAELKVRWINKDKPKAQHVAAIYMDGLVDDLRIAAFIVNPLQAEAGIDPPSVPAKTEIETVDEAINALTHGDCLVFRRNRHPAAYKVIMWAHRQVERAQLEPSEMGSQEGFVEDLFTNVVLLRRRLRTNKFKTEAMTIGKLSPADVRIMYLHGVVRDELVEEVRTRLREIDIDGMVGINYLEELTRDNAWSPFPNNVTTARPDRVAGMLLEGNVAIMVDGSPMASVVPGTINAMVQTSDDYYHNFYVGSFTRLIRWIAATVGLLAPAFYVAIISFHHEIIPTKLLFTIAAGREGVPFSPVIEAFGMEMAFELLREAGLRVPMQIGQAVSIVGVLVIGQAAVQAGMVSPLMIVIVGMTAISTFAIPSLPLANTVRLLRFPLILLGGFLGLFGVLFGLMLMMALLLSSRSYGVPYVTPMVPLWPKGLVDSVWRSPMWQQRHRPWYNVRPDMVHQQPPGQMPEPNEERPSNDPRKSR